METQGLVFIPDISGFTRFVHETEISHSRIIIKELLETLINANTIGLKISEIEGDAILFYRFGELPDLKEIYGQIEKMFCEFHSYLSAYDMHKFCQCRPCVSAVNLSLKVITHYGEFTEYKVGNFEKLIGKDIIIAHQLLKNNIDQHEYWLLTQSLMPKDALERFQPWMTWDSSFKTVEDKNINFHYTQLSGLKAGLKPVSSPQIEIPKRRKVFSVSKMFETHIVRLFHATGDFNYRHRWQEGVTRVEEVSHFLPRIGMRCRRVMDDGETMIYSSSFSFTADSISFSETDENKSHALYFTLEEKGEGKILLTIDYYIAAGLANAFLFSLKKRKVQDSFRRSVELIEPLLAEFAHLPPED